MKLTPKASARLEYAIVLLFFVAGTNLFWYFKTAGLTEVFSNLLIRPFDPFTAHIQTSLGSLAFGLIIILLEVHFFPWLAKHLSRQYRQIVWAISVLLLILSIVFSIETLFLWIVQNHPLVEAMMAALPLLKSELFIAFTTHCFLLCVAVSFVRQLRENIGEAIFLNYLFGKYAAPLVEHRSFMFLDLNNSTSLAEALGHATYSRFLNQCFDDILEALMPFRFEVYQFVGDEVVLTWKTEQDSLGMAWEMYQAVATKLSENQGYYRSLYGQVPTFKAGVSSGEVTTALVGRQHKFRAYHGDVLNTAARLLEQCKRLKEPILFTDFYLKSLTHPLSFEPTLLSEMQLRGKGSVSRIYRGAPVATGVAQRQCSISTA